MKVELPPPLVKDLIPTRDYIQAVAHILGNLQRAFIPKDPRDWHYGLEVGLRGLLTQPLIIDSQEIRGSLDFVRHKVRLGGSSWSLKHYTPPEIFNNVQIWLESHNVKTVLEKPAFTTSYHFDTEQATQYAEALWWVNTQFRALKAGQDKGRMSPILLYPHHFDLSLVWFPWDDKRQLAIGFSTGDETIPEPYLYLTAYPEPDGFSKLVLPPEAHWQTAGFSGAILPYQALSDSNEPAKLFHSYALSIFKGAQSLLS